MRWWRGSVAVVWLSVLAVLAAGSGLAATTNLLSNGGFEGKGAGSLKTWTASGGALRLVAGDGGGFAARVTAQRAARVSAHTTRTAIPAATAAATYDLAGAVRSDVPGQTVCLKLKELPATGSTVIGSAQSCLVTTTDWQPFADVDYVAATSGDRLTVNAIEARPAKGASYDIDSLSLTMTPPPDLTAPTVPGGLAAAADSPTAVSLSWSASTDSGGSGLAGYDVYRDGDTAPLVTLGPDTTGYEDDSVSPDTSYSYALDAFDNAGNHSAPSDPVNVSTPAEPPGPCGLLPPPASPPVYDHVVVVMDENLAYQNWIGSPSAPYTNELAGQCALATDAVAATHPSQPNYVATNSGLLQVWNGSTQHDSGDNLFHQLTAAGLSWGGLEEAMPANCAAGSSGFYKTGHNAPLWFTDLGPAASGGDGTCQRTDVPLDTATFDPSTLASYTWVTPDLCDDMDWTSGCPQPQSAEVATGDAWLQSFLAGIFASTDYQQGHTLVLIMWDEGTDTGSRITNGVDCTTVTDIDASGCHVPLIAASASITPGTVDTTAYSDYSVLAALEGMWGLPLLNRAQTATPLGAAMGFTQPARPRPGSNPTGPPPSRAR